MANNTTKKAGSNKSFIDRMGGQKFIVLLVVIALFIFFCAMSPNFRKYTTFINILDFSYYIVLMAIGVAFPLMTGGVDLSIGTGLVCYSLVGGYLIVHKGMPTIVGILAAIILGMLIGYLLKSKTPDGLLNTLAFVIFSIFGVYTLYQGLKLISSSVCRIPVLLILIAVVVVFAGLRRKKKKRKKIQETNRIQISFH